MAVLEMCDCDDIVDDQDQGYGDGESVCDGDGDAQGDCDGLGALRPLHCGDLVSFPAYPSDADLHLATDIGFPRKPRRLAESATPPRHSHTQAEMGMDRDIVGYGEDDEDSTYFVNFIGFPYPAHVFFEVGDAGEETTETGTSVVVVVRGGYGEDDVTCVVNCFGHVRLLSESDVGLGDGNAGPPVIADEEDWVDHNVPVPPQFSLEHVLGWPMRPMVPDTCALIAATVCLEAVHRRKFEHKYGRGTFPCRAAAPRKLRAACFRELYRDTSTGKLRRTWAPGQGADVGRVLTKLKQLGGARTTNAPTPAPFFLPLADWTCYSYYDGLLTHQTAARLIFEQGPCIGCLFNVPGHRREDREMLINKDPDRFGMHALVCYAYRYTKRGTKLKIKVLDNAGWMAALGTTRWVDFEEIDQFYVLYVYTMLLNHLLGRSPPLVYPFSGFI